MKKRLPDLVEKARVETPGFATPRGATFGAFIVRYQPRATTPPEFLQVIACDGNETGWDHVSVKVKYEDRCPTWDEMCFVKRLFFEPTEWVIQYHPAEADYVNVNPGVLHLWRPVNQELPKPPRELV